MKKRLNNKGFTLIETVITFAIVAVVGGMFILGFSNVIHLMTDAELISYLIISLLIRISRQRSSQSSAVNLPANMI